MGEAEPLEGGMEQEAEWKSRVAKRGHWGRPPPTCPHLWRAQPPGPQRGKYQNESATGIHVFGHDLGTK